MRGHVSVSPLDLLGCFDFPDDGDPTDECGFLAAGSMAPAYLRELILEPDEAAGFTADERGQLLTWCTALAALPCGGLKKKISLRHFPGRSDDDLPNVHTCTPELHLPAYTSRARLRQKLRTAFIEHGADGFLIQ